MHIDNELVEFMTAGEPEYEEIIEEYGEVMCTYVTGILWKLHA